MSVARNTVRPVVYLHPYGSHAVKEGEDFEDVIWNSYYSDEVVHLEIAPEIDEQALRSFLATKAEVKCGS
jgi:hypothetical protein